MAQHYRDCNDPIHSYTNGMSENRATVCTFAFDAEGKVTAAEICDGWSQQLAKGSLNEALLADYVMSRADAASISLPAIPATIRRLPKNVTTELSARTRSVIEDALAALTESRNSPVLKEESSLESIEVHDPDRHVILTCVGDTVVSCEVDTTWARAKDWTDIEEVLVEAFAQVEAAESFTPTRRWLAQLHQIAQEFTEYQEG